MSNLECSNDDKWSHIPDDILESILERLDLFDYLRIADVCSSWQATVTKSIANKHCTTSPLPGFPLVFLQQCKHITQPSFFFSLSTKRFSKFIITPPNKLKFKICHGSVQGWMILCEFSYIKQVQFIFFFNPITNCSVHLPAKLNYPTTIKKIVVSSKPTDPNCIVACMLSDHCNLIFCKVSDKSWTRIEGDIEAGIIFMEVEILDGKLYVLTSQLLNSILVYDLQQDHKPIKPKILAHLPAVTPEPILNIDASIFRFLAVDASCGDLLLIYVFYNSVFSEESLGYLNKLKEFIDPPEITTFQVFKFDRINSSNQGNYWVEVKNLGNRLLFVGNLKSFVVSSIGLNGPKELVQENSIYFSFLFLCAEGSTNPWKGMQIGKYCMIDKRMEYFGLETSIFDSLPVPSWFIPNVA